MTLREERDLLKDEEFSSYFKGFQIAGYLNFVREDVTGLQLAGGVNSSGGDMNGLQFPE